MKEQASVVLGASKIEKNKPYMAMFLVQFIYAGMALLSKAALLQGLSPSVFVTYRQAFAFLVLAPFAFFLERDKTASLSYSILWRIFLISLFGITVSLNLYYYGMNYTSATCAAATTNTIPAITFVMAALFRMESISIKQWHGIAKLIGSVVVFSGALVFDFVRGPPILKFMKQQPENFSINDRNHKVDWIKGSLIILLSNTVWSLWLIFQAPIIKQYPAKLRLTTLQCLFSCVQSAVWAISVDRSISSWKLGWDLSLFSVLYCGVFVSGICYWLQVWTAERKGPVFIAAFTPMSLAITALVSAFLWKENLRVGSACGIVLLVGGLYAVLWGKGKEIKVQTTTCDQPKTAAATTAKEETALECITIESASATKVQLLLLGHTTKQIYDQDPQLLNK